MEEQEVSELWERYADIPAHIAERKIFSQMKSKGRNLTKVMTILRNLRYPNLQRYTSQKSIPLIIIHKFEDENMRIIRRNYTVFIK